MKKVVCSYCGFAGEIEKEREGCPQCGFSFEMAAEHGNPQQSPIDLAGKISMPKITRYSPPPSPDSSPEHRGSDPKIESVPDTLPDPVLPSGPKVNSSPFDEEGQPKAEDKKSIPLDYTIPDDPQSVVAEEDPFADEPLEAAAPLPPPAYMAESSLPSVVMAAKRRFRLIASLIDFAAVYIIAFALWKIAAVMSHFSGSLLELNSPLWAPAAMLFMTIFILYQGWFNGLVGVSPGKAIFKLRVVTKTGRAPGFVRGCIRGLLGLFLTLLGGFNGIILILTKRSRGLHDIFTKTFVIETGR